MSVKFTETVYETGRAIKHLIDESIVEKKLPDEKDGKKGKCVECFVGATGYRVPERLQIIKGKTLLSVKYVLTVLFHSELSDGEDDVRREIVSVKVYDKTSGSRIKVSTQIGTEIMKSMFQDRQIINTVFNKLFFSDSPFDQTNPEVELVHFVKGIGEKYGVANFLTLMDIGKIIDLVR